MTAAVTGGVPPLTAATALRGLQPSAEPSAPSRRERRRAAGRRVGPVVPLVLAGTLVVTASITGVVTPIDARAKAPKPKPEPVERGKTVREAFSEAKRAAAHAAAALRATIAPPTLYTVGERDTIPDIAARYGLSTASLLALNGLSWSTSIHPGQILKLTSSGAIAPVAAEAEASPVPEEQRHTVAAGESLSSVAAQYGVDVAALLSANGFSPSSIIYPGQLITVPPPPPPVVAPPSYMVFFDWDRSNLSAQALNTIKQAAQAFKTKGNARITATGHTDTSGSEQYNMALSLRRANAVKDALVREGVPATAISVIGRGEQGLLVQTGPNVREPQNRRVEIVIQ